MSEENEGAFRQVIETAEENSSKTAGIPPNRNPPVGGPDADALLNEPGSRTAPREGGDIGGDAAALIGGPTGGNVGAGVTGSEITGSNDATLGPAGSALGHRPTAEDEH